MEAIIALITLSALEIVLGIDNIIFISILSDKLPENQRTRARFVGLGLALVMRILLLLSITWVLGLQKPLLTLFGNEFSGRDLILILGGLFLIGKATYEIHHKVEMADQPHPIPKRISFGWAVVQIMLIDLVFSVDSVLTAIGMVRELWVMIAAVVVSIAFMLAFVGSVSRLIDAHPSLKVLALAFLVLIGFNLLGEGFGYHIPKGYTYFAMAFAVAVEVINIRIGARKKT